MPDRRGRKGSSDDFLPEDIIPWARETWRERDEVARLPNGAWMLRCAADALGIDQGEIDKLLSEGKSLASAACRFRAVYAWR